MAISRSRAGDDSASRQTPLLFPSEIYDLTKQKAKGLTQED